MFNIIVGRYIFDGERRRRVVPRVQNYYEDVLPQMTISDFQSHFRFSRDQFEILLLDLGQRHVNSPQPCRRWPRPKIILVSVWTLATQDSYRSIADRFNISKSFVFLYLHYFTRLIIEVKDVIKWPNDFEKNKNVQDFIRRGFPGTIGALDGCHINIMKPRERAEAYYTRKNKYDVNCMAVCNAQKLFIYLYIGDPGSYHDSRVWRRSSLGHRILENENYLTPFHLIWDKAFPLNKSLIVPFRDNGHLTENQRNFNERHSAARMVIEHSFGLLKSRFRRLNHLELVRQEDISRAIKACCIMHNLITSQVEEIDDNILHIDNPNLIMNYVDGRHKRDAIALQFMVP
ncbi:UNVERIFIED_CONTAM: hypothetical protein RMT77_018006 [Armadillidium vulgare]